MLHPCGSRARKEGQKRPIACRATATHPIAFEDLARVQGVSDPQLSRWSTSIPFTIAAPEFPKGSEMLNIARHLFLVLLFGAAAMSAAHSQDTKIIVRVSGASATEMATISKVLQTRADELRTGLFGSTSATVNSNLVALTFSGWVPQQRQVEAIAVSDRKLRVSVGPSSSDILFTDADVVDARASLSRTDLAIRLNEAGMDKLRLRGDSLVGKWVSVYWNNRLISRAKVTAPLVRDIAVTVPSQDDAKLMAIVLRAGPLPKGTSLTLVQ